MAATKKCRKCVKTVYPMDPQINLDGTIYHRACGKCDDCNCQITISNFCKNESSDSTILLCKIHYFKRFHEGGAYLGGENFKVKAVRDINAMNAPIANRESTDGAEVSAPSVTAAAPTPIEKSVISTSAEKITPVKLDSTSTEKDSKPKKLVLKNWPPKPEVIESKDESASVQETAET